MFFASIVIIALTEPNFSEDGTRSYVLWRLNIAHDYRYVDPLTHQSLASRVCSQEAGIELSQGQSDA